MRPTLALETKTSLIISRRKICDWTFFPISRLARKFSNFPEPWISWLKLIHQGTEMSGCHVPLERFVYLIIAWSSVTIPKALQISKEITPQKIALRLWTPITHRGGVGAYHYTNCLICISSVWGGVGAYYYSNPLKCLHRARIAGFASPRLSSARLPSCAWVSLSPGPAACNRRFQLWQGCSSSPVTWPPPPCRSCRKPRRSREWHAGTGTRQTACGDHRWPRSWCTAASALQSDQQPRGYSRVERLEDAPQSPHETAGLPSLPRTISVSHFLGNDRKTGPRCILVARASMLGRTSTHLRPQVPRQFSLRILSLERIWLQPPRRACRCLRRRRLAGGGK